MNIDIEIRNGAPIAPAAALQGLRYLIYAMEMNLRGKPNAPFMVIGGRFEANTMVLSIHFHTDAEGQQRCMGVIDDEDVGDA